jgi:hypothetical protein
VWPPRFALHRTRERRFCPCSPAALRASAFFGAQPDAYSELTSPRCVHPLEPVRIKEAPAQVCRYLQAESGVLHPALHRYLLAVEGEAVDAKRLVVDEQPLGIEVEIAHRSDEPLAATEGDRHVDAALAATVDPEVGDAEGEPPAAQDASLLLPTCRWGRPVRRI